MDRATRTAITDRAAIMERRATTTPRATSANMVSTPATATTSTTIRAAWGPRDPELFLRLLRERGQALDRHRPIDFVVEGSDPFVGTHGADEEDDRTGVVPPHAVEDGFQVDPRPAHVDHRAPPLTGGRSATSSP